MPPKSPWAKAPTPPKPVHGLSDADFPPLQPAATTNDRQSPLKAPIVANTRDLSNVGEKKQRKSSKRRWRPLRLAPENTRSKSAPPTHWGHLELSAPPGPPPSNTVPTQYLGRRVRQNGESSTATISLFPDPSLYPVGFLDLTSRILDYRPESSMQAASPIPHWLATLRAGTYQLPIMTRLSFSIARRPRSHRPRTKKTYKRTKVKMPPDYRSSPPANVAKIVIPKETYTTPRPRIKVGKDGPRRTYDLKKSNLLLVENFEQV